MTASLWGARPRSIFWPQVGEVLPVLVGPATARPSLGVAAIQLAANFAQAALSLTPIDPPITYWLSPAAWPAPMTGRGLFRLILFLVTESGTMKKLNMFSAALAAFGLMMLLSDEVSAHPGVEGVFECHEDASTEDSEQTVLPKVDEAGVEKSRKLKCHDCEDDEESSRAAVTDGGLESIDQSQAVVAEYEEADDSER